MHESNGTHAHTSQVSCSHTSLESDIILDGSDAGVECDGVLLEDYFFLDKGVGLLLEEVTFVDIRLLKLLVIFL